MGLNYSDKNADAVGTVGDTYNISASNDQFSIAIDGGSNQVFTLTHGAARTAAQVVADLSSLTSATASVVTINGVNLVRVRTTSANGATSIILVNAPSNNANSILGFTATSYTGGAYVDQIFPADTKQLLINGVETQLLNAGWVTISGHNTSNLLMQSSMSPNPQNIRIRLRLKDNGNNCVVGSLENAFGTKTGGNSTSSGFQLLPQASKGWKVVANKYWAYIFVPGTVGFGRDLGYVGMPYVPSWLQGVVWEAGWLGGSAQSDTDTARNGSFRIYPGEGVPGVVNCGNHQHLCNGNIWEDSNTQNQLGQLAIMTAGTFTIDNNFGPLGNWHDGSSLMLDAVIAWGAGSNAEPCTGKGYMFDHFVSTDIFPVETVISADSHNWRAINQNIGFGRWTIFAAIS